GPGWRGKKLGDLSGVENIKGPCGLHPQGQVAQWGERDRNLEGVEIASSAQSPSLCQNLVVISRWLISLRGRLGGRGGVGRCPALARPFVSTAAPASRTCALSGRVCTARSFPRCRDSSRAKEFASRPWTCGRRSAFEAPLRGASCSAPLSIRLTAAGPSSSRYLGSGTAPPSGPSLTTSSPGIPGCGGVGA